MTARPGRPDDREQGDVEEAAQRVEAYLTACMSEHEAQSGRNYDVGHDDLAPLWSDDLRTLIRDARVAREAAAEAWDEGAAKARQYRDDLDLAPLNPYRAALTATEEPSHD